MKAIKVFLASSEELKDEREKFGNLIRRLDDIYLKRGIHVQLLMWEDMDSCYNNVRKQDEYNAWIRESQIFVALFYTKAGQYTREEFEVAKEGNRLRKVPKLMIFCRDLKPGEEETSELIEFKKTLGKELGHFWGRFGNSDKLHLDFVMWLERSESNLQDVLNIENGKIMIDGIPIAEMDNLPFAIDNKEYQSMKEELEALPEEIEVFRFMVEAHPDQKKYKDQLQKKLNHYNALKEEFANHQRNLFTTAKRIVETQFKKVSFELQRAIDEFETGHIEAANTILDGIEQEAERHVEQLDCYRSLVHQDIEALLLKTETLMADLSIPIEQRIEYTMETYQKAIKWAKKSALDKDKYAKLLRDYGNFLFEQAKYEQALSVWEHELALNEDLFGIDYPATAASYNNVGNVYYHYGNYLEYYQKALSIREKSLGEDHPETAKSYNNIGLVYYCYGDYEKAMDYYQKDLFVSEKIYGSNHLETAKSYNNVGLVYEDKGDYNKALEYYQNALEIRKNVLGIYHPEVASVYLNIGIVYDNLQNSSVFLSKSN